VLNIAGDGQHLARWADINVPFPAKGAGVAHARHYHTLENMTQDISPESSPTAAS
jgi:hypothetical protein